MGTRIIKARMHLKEASTENENVETLLLSFPIYFKSFELIE